MKRLILIFAALSLLGTVAIPVALAHGEHVSSIVEGTISVTCRPPIHVNNDDPILFPGQVGAAHTHEFAGSRTTNANSTYNSMVQSDSNCFFKGDTAGYWFPTLKRPNGTNFLPYEHWFYYRDIGCPGGPEHCNWGQEPVVYPPGFKYIAGATVPGGNNLDTRHWRCKGVDTNGIPNCAGTGNNDAISAEVAFPQCWDGENLWLAGNAHVTYSTRIVNGQKFCPTSHPVRLVFLQGFAVWYRFQEGNLNFASNGYRLASDAPGQAAGTSLHADFWNTWNQAELQRMWTACITNHGDVPESQNGLGPVGAPQEPSCLQIAGPATQPPPLEGEPSPTPTPTPTSTSTPPPTTSTPPPIPTVTETVTTTATVTETQTQTVTQTVTPTLCTETTEDGRTVTVTACP